MSASHRIRQWHRWLSLAFTIAVVANIVAMMIPGSPQWIGFLALVPLLPLLATGIYLFLLPYRRKAAGQKNALSL
ncbi:MAG: hypothetical protein KJ755_03705 [Alphaproteobacteria bacterium]|uniref:hypothetical protein n=1 Tax=Rhizobium sp. 'Codium 1' TaxID=2940484 RepID=UPI001E4E0177|nr:hypothetical protein [Rhizobium sp. 'Codium 1']MBU2326453.1 hypothetical protein [Alphaproteobacteria bacterium]MCC8932198.1 hypothetical protein [Rhizobium sp. 'Codium 1']